MDSISTPIEQGRHSGKGVPWAVDKHDLPLNNRQQALLDKLPEFDSRVTVGKNDASMTDLAALTAKTGNEFAMFTRGSERLVVRGDNTKVNINPNDAAKMSAQGYKWSGHTHVGNTVRYLVASAGDRVILKEFGQSISVIYNSIGDFNFVTGF
jgi:hypothetical protein